MLCPRAVQMFLQLFKQLFQLASAEEDRQHINSKGSASDTTAEPLARNALLSQQLLILVHRSMSRAMFSRDHLSLALHLAKHLMPEQFPEAEWAVLLNCSSAVIGGSSSSNSSGTPSAAASAAGLALPNWLGAERAAAFEQIAGSLPELVTAARLSDARIWAPWGAPAAAQAAGCGAVPVAVSSALTILQQLILVAAFQPERWARRQHDVASMWRVHAKFDQDNPPRPVKPVCGNCGQSQCQHSLGKAVCITARDFA
jgi:hypothetical protein